MSSEAVLFDLGRIAILEYIVGVMEFWWKAFFDELLGGFNCWVAAVDIQDEVFGGD